MRFLGIIIIALAIGYAIHREGPRLMQKFRGTTVVEPTTPDPHEPTLKLTGKVLQRLTDGGLLIEATSALVMSGETGRVMEGEDKKYLGVFALVGIPKEVAMADGE